MKTLQLRGRDLVVVGRDYATVTGVAKTEQDMTAAILEPIGNDRFHLGFGSYLDDYLGKIADSMSAYEVQQEVTRVVANYMSVQQAQITADALSQSASKFSYGEIVVGVKDVSVELAQDSVKVKIILTNFAGNTVTINSEVL